MAAADPGLPAGLAVLRPQDGGLPADRQRLPAAGRTGGRRQHPRRRSRRPARPRQPRPAGCCAPSDARSPRHGTADAVMTAAEFSLLAATEQVPPPPGADPELRCRRRQSSTGSIRRQAGRRGPARHSRPALRRPAHRPLELRPAAQDREDPHGHAGRDQPAPAVRLRRRRHHRLPDRRHRGRLQVLDDLRWLGTAAGGQSTSSACSITANDAASTWPPACFACRRTYLRGKPNRDAKRQLSAASRARIRRLWPDRGQLAENVFLHMDASTRDRIFGARAARGHPARPGPDERALPQRAAPDHPASRAGHRRAAGRLHEAGPRQRRRADRSSGRKASWCSGTRTTTRWWRPPSACPCREKASSSPRGWCPRGRTAATRLPG